MTYKMVIIGGKARMSRPSNVLYPLPKVRLDRKVNRYAHVKELAPTVIARPVRAMAGDMLPMVRYSITFP